MTRRTLSALAPLCAAVFFAVALGACESRREVAPASRALEETSSPAPTAVSAKEDSVPVAEKEPHSSSGNRIGTAPGGSGGRTSPAALPARSPPSNLVASTAAASSSPDGRRLVYLSLPQGPPKYRADIGELHLVDADGGRDRVIVPAARHYGEHRAAVWWGPDELVHLDAAGATVRRVVHAADSGARRIEVYELIRSPPDRGTMLAVMTRRGHDHPVAAAIGVDEVELADVGAIFRRGLRRLR